MSGGVIIILKEYDVLDFTPINYPTIDTDSTCSLLILNIKQSMTMLKLDLLGL